MSEGVCVWVEDVRKECSSRHNIHVGDSVGPLPSYRCLEAIWKAAGNGDSTLREEFFEARAHNPERDGERPALRVSSHDERRPSRKLGKPC